MRRHFPGALCFFLTLAIGTTPGVVFAQSQQSAEAKRYADFGELYRQSEKYEAAMQMYKKAIQIDPDYFPAHFGLARVLLGTDSLEQAVAEFKDALRINPGHEDAHAFLGAAYRRLKRYDLAIAELQQAIMIDPSDAWNHKVLADAYYGADRYDEAIEQCNKALALRPDYADAYESLGDAYAGKDDYQTAAENYQKALELNPEDRTVQVKLELVLAAQPRGNLRTVSATLEFLKSKVAEDPSNPVHRYSLGALYSLLDSLEAAERELKEALALRPVEAETRANAHASLAKVYTKQGKYDLAFTEISAAVDLNPRNPGYYKTKGDIYAERDGNQDRYEAIAAYQQAIHLDPSHEDAHAMLGEVYRRLGKYDEAIAALQEATRIDSGDAWNHKVLADAYRGRDRYDEAIAESKKALALRPNYTEAYVSLGDAYVGKDDYPSAAASYEKALELNPFDPAIRAKLELSRAGQAVDSGGNLSGGGAVLELLKLKVTENPSDPEAHYLLGRYYELIDSLAAAERMYRQTIRLKPDYVEAHKDLADVYRKMRKYPSALEEVQKAISLDPADAANYKRKGDIYYDREQSPEDLNQALIAYAKSVELDSLYADGYSAWGEALRYMKRYEEAVGKLQRAIALDPEDAWAHKKLADAYFGLGDRDDNSENYSRALEEYRLALQHRPNFPEAYVGMAQALRVLRRYDQAIEILQLALQLSPENEDMYSALGETYRLNKQADLAISALKKAIALAPHDPFPHQVLGSIFVEQSQYDDAIRETKIAIELKEEQGEPRQTELYLRLCRVYYLRYGGSSELINAALNRETDRVLVLLMQAVLNLREERTDLAIAKLNELQRIDSVFYRDLDISKLGEIFEGFGER